MNQFLRAAGLKEIRVNENQRTVVQTLKTELLGMTTHVKKGVRIERKNKKLCWWGSPGESQGRRKDMIKIYCIEILNTKIN